MYNQLRTTLDNIDNDMYLFQHDYNLHNMYRCSTVWSWIALQNLKNKLFETNSDLVLSVILFI
jgi:hypothetical protein